MSLFFSESGLRRLDEFARPGLLCVFDFDGTLAPIVQQPHEARLPLDIRHRLIALGAYAPVAIITGRSVSDIKLRLGFEPNYVVGNHGLEGVPGWQQQGERHAALCSTWKAALTTALRQPAFDPAIRIEDKHYSLSVHYRQARELEDTERHLTDLFNTLSPRPRIISGKCVFNLLPVDAADKGRALEQLIRVSGARNAIYVGDDVTDEDVFRLRRPDVLSIRVEYSSDSAADFFLEQWDDMFRLFDELLKRLRNTRIDTRPQACGRQPRMTSWDQPFHSDSQQ